MLIKDKEYIDAYNVALSQKPVNLDCLVEIMIESG